MKRGEFSRYDGMQTSLETKCKSEELVLVEWLNRLGREVGC